MSVTVEDRATELLHALAGPDAAFRPHQLEAVRDLVADRARVLCVQRTGWGKSAVYFIATALLREQGAGPALIVSPLLALMRNQIAAAERLGIRAHTINSTNRDAWEEVEALLAADAVDLLLISPERLNNPQFRERMLPLFAERVGLAGGRRGALRLGLGPRLPARLPAAGRDARAAPDRRRGARHDRDRERPRRRRRRGAAARRRRRRAAAHLPRPARPLQPAPRGRRAAGAGRPARVAGDVAAAARGLGDRLHAHQARRRDRRAVARLARDRRRGLQRRGRGGAPRSPSRSGCWPTRSRPSSPRARSGWATTSPTSASSCTTRRPARSSPTTSRSGAPAAASTTPTWCSCAAPRTAGSRTSSSSRRSRGASSSTACSRRSTRRGRRG